jgi:putative Holliday junction resolvase
MRVLAVDPGGRRFGLAVADDVTGVATPLEVVAYAGIEAAAEVIDDAAREHRAELVVIGLPTSADGNETPACARSRGLARALARRGAATELQPEHLSSHEARRRACAVGRRAGLPVDDLAAQVIAEDFLACRSARSEEGR